MRKYITPILFSGALLASLNSNGQEKDKTEKQLKTEQQSQRDRSFGGQKTENEFKDDAANPGQKSNNYTNDKQQAGDTSTNAGGRQQGTGEVVPRNEDESDGDQRSNTPTVIQRTSSESGSPAVLSQDNGSGRDGTNNVQRAKPNIAGAKEPGNMNLDKKTPGERNRNIGTEKTRRPEDVPQTDVSKKEQKQDQQTVSKQRAQDKRSGEDKLKSDNQDRSSDKETHKERRKNRRKKDKDSGK